MRVRFAMEIPRRIYAVLVEQAGREYPNECCGLLCGPASSRDPFSREAGLRAEREPSVRTATHIYPLVNALQSPTRFESDARGMFDALRSIRERDLEILAVYHSHPSSEPVPSRTDLEWNYAEGVQSAILGRDKGVWRLRSWWLSPSGFEEAELVALPENL